MASESRILEALNSSRTLGLGHEDNTNLELIICNYFGDDKDEDSDDDDEESGSVLETTSDIELDEQEPMDLDSDAEVGLPDNDEPEEEPLDLAEDVLQAVGLNCVLSEDDAKELAFVRDKKCRCRNPTQGLGCSHKFDDQFVFNMRLQINALSPANKAMFMLGKISSGGVRSSEMTQATKRTAQQERKRQRTDKGYFVNGVKVCRDTFLFMHMSSDKYVTKLVKHYTLNGIEVPMKDSRGFENNTKAFSAEDVMKTVNFIANYAERNGMVIPGRVPGFKSADPRIRLLPSSENKTSIWRIYTQHFEDLSRATGEDAVIMKRSSFHKIWNQYLPFVLTTRPRTDLCWKCQQNNRHIYQSANETDAAKAAKLAQQIEHLRVVRLERELYQLQVKEAKNVVGDTALGKHLPCSWNKTMHYSFDYAQQVHFPNDPEQPGPLYFLTPRKCGVFGVNCEGFPKQINYFVDEGMSISKGSNAVVSYIHHFFENYGLGETSVELHCDNCTGQNKNKFALWYMAWRCIHQLHRKLGLNFLIVGHTKFAPDWCFGLLKQRYRRCHVSTLGDIEDACRSSSVSGVNIPQLVGTEDGQVLVHTYDWQSFLTPYFKPLPGIKSYQHMRFDHEQPGKVFYKQYADSEEHEYQLLQNPDVLPPLQLPASLSPPGLSHERASYLFKNIRQFCAQDHRADITCPLPSPVDKTVEPGPS